VLKSARYFVSQRENLRYYRTRGFGMVRRLMLAMGSRLAEGNVIDAAGDIFWLTLPELETIIKAPAPAHSVVASRKNLYRQYETAPLPQRLRTYGMPPGLISLQQEPAPRKKEGDLQGIPCSAGIVRAPVRLVTYSDDLKSLDGALLVTYATDPGFVVLFASASGILTERGSLLSHAAIVSREMGIPCIVGIDDLMQSLKNGDIVEMDGSTGSVKIISA
jgi:pyruvate,water dikinase